MTIDRLTGSRAAVNSAEVFLPDDKTYKATYLGSGTFIISKPKRNREKLHRSRVKNPQRGARK